MQKLFLHIGFYHTAAEAAIKVVNSAEANSGTISSQKVSYNAYAIRLTVQKFAK